MYLRTVCWLEFRDHLVYRLSLPFYTKPAVIFFRKSETTYYVKGPQVVECCCLECLMDDVVLIEFRVCRVYGWMLWWFLIEVAMCAKFISTELEIVWLIRRCGTRVNDSPKHLRFTLQGRGAKHYLFGYQIVINSFDRALNLIDLDAVMFVTWPISECEQTRSRRTLSSSVT